VNKKVWFPAGNWFNFFTGMRIHGGQWQKIQATLEDIPVYAKEGAIVPLAPKPKWGGVSNPTDLEVYIFPGADNSFCLYEDDGETTDYQHGKYALTKFEIVNLWVGKEPGQATLGSNLKFIIHPATGEPSVIPDSRRYRLHLRGVEPGSTASLPGNYDPATRTLSLDPFTLHPNETCRIDFRFLQQGTG
jgi:hypothetical protein